MGRGDLTATRGAPALVSSTLRELLSPQPLTIEFARKTRPRLPASTAPKPLFEEAEDEAPPDLRVELRHSDRALSDLRTELWQAQERARRLASEVWRMDGERSRVRAVQAQLQAEVAGLLQAVRLVKSAPESMQTSYDAKIELCRLLVLKAAWMMDEAGNKNAKSEIAQIKVAAPRMALKIIDDAIQAFGGAGVSADTPLAELYATVRTLRIADGPDEVHNRAIARLEYAKHGGRPSA
jgi:alkylation response protein AidB-like acyl-CoA dehydrogenase